MVFLAPNDMIFSSKNILATYLGFSFISVFKVLALKLNTNCNVSMILIIYLYDYIVLKKSQKKSLTNLLYFRIFIITYSLINHITQ